MDKLIGLLVLLGLGGIVLAIVIPTVQRGCGLGGGKGEGNGTELKEANEMIEGEMPMVSDHSVLIKVAGEKYLIDNETLDFERVLEKLDAIKESEPVKEIRIDSKDARMNQYNELIQACKERGIGYKEI